MAFADRELNFLSFVEFYAAETRVVDLTEVDEYIFSTIIRLDESVTFFAVEPFNGSCNHICHGDTFLC